ncbi:hypothetical protein A3D69_00390 [Candidatus Uhrbacteria bacterium RIFCSPHIGHO2_02_FULL_54_11]|nr:MAG: hypothetical protein A3D69_00390 [Candidatus Uhrbacteria bacterium RIFCSPHIGHO2_02_FULL_54_11]
MSKTPNYDAKVKTILDATTSGERVCALTGEKWIMTEEEIGWYKKFNVPPHPWAPLVRLKHLMGFPSGIAIWKKPHAETHEPILSFVHPDSPYQIITDKEWFNREFAQTRLELNPAKPFFDQFRELAYSIPVGNLRDDGSNVNCVGVDIITSQDSYMMFGGYGNKRNFYSAITYLSEDSCLLTNVKAIHRSYMINACADLHNCRYCFQNGQLMNCTFSFACDNLENCYGTCNHSHKKYLFWNEQLSQGEWEKCVGEIDLSDRRVWDAEVAKFHKMVMEDTYWPQDFRVEPLEDWSGEYLLTATRVHDSYWIDKGLDLYHCWVHAETEQSAFTVWSGWGDRAYMSSDLLTPHEVKMSMRLWRSQNMEYCMDCYDCENCFGCVGLRKKTFHIYNKPYAEDEYWARVDEIKCAMLDRGEYGMFFPAEISQVGYQFSMGQMFLGYTDAELDAFGASRFDTNKGNVDVGDKVIRSSDLPDRLTDVDPARHIGKPILDEKLGRMFTITPSEFKFYQKHGVPIPREHFLTRMTNLFRHANTPIPEDVTCAKCGIEVRTWKNALFSGRRRVLCRPCYLKYLEARG